MSADAEAEAARARVEKLQALSEQQLKEINAASKEFEAKMRAAQTPAERTALQQEFQQFQRQKQEEYKQKLTELQRP